jgi:hypothetical protein
MEAVEAAFWEQARRGLPWFRFFRRSIAPEQLDAEFLGSFVEAEWLSVRCQMRPGDQIWPFEFHVRAFLGMRSGYLVLRQGRPIAGIVTVVS